MSAAVSKWRLFLRASLEHSTVGQQINASPGEMLDIVRAAMGVKSSSTLLSRSNSILAYMRWHTIALPHDDVILAICLVLEGHRSTRIQGHHAVSKHAGSVILSWEWKEP